MTPERVARLRAVLDKRQPDLTLVTDHVHKGRNLSALIRSCDAAGIVEMHSAMTKTSYKAFRGTAMGSHRYVGMNCELTIEQALLPLKKKGYQVIAADVGDDSIDYRQVDYTLPTAILFGAEKEGLSQQGAALTDQFVTVPMMGMVESFNVSVAAGIILSEAVKQRSDAGLYSHRRIDDSSYERLFFQWAHPKVRQFCDRNGLDYPPLKDDGEIDNPSRWYAKVRENNLAN